MTVRMQVASGSASIDALDRRSAVGRVGVRERAGRPESGFACRDPEREIRHARERLELNAMDGSQTMRHRVKQGAEDKRARDFEFVPKLGFRTPVCFCNGC